MGPKPVALGSFSGVVLVVVPAAVPGAVPAPREKPLAAAAAGVEEDVAGTDEVAPKRFAAGADEEAPSAGVPDVEPSGSCWAAVPGAVTGAEAPKRGFVVVLVAAAAALPGAAELLPPKRVVVVWAAGFTENIEGTDADAAGAAAEAGWLPPNMLDDGVVAAD